MRTVLRRRDESGIYAILYSLLVLVTIGVAATVVDLALMREGRTAGRMATDAAAVAAAANLNPLDPTKTDPRAACAKAWVYLQDSVDELGDVPDGCASLPAPPGVVCTATTPAQVASWTEDGYTVRVTWPVPAGSPLLTAPDVAPGSVTQAANDDFDGTNRCDRIAVQLARTTSTVFAGALGVEQVSVSSSSVGRALAYGKGREIVAALNILETSDCGALKTSGQGAVQVKAVGDQLGFIAVESSGTGSCGTGGAATIETSNNSLNYIRADGPSDVPGAGMLQTYALNPAPVGSPTHAYSTGPIAPTPTLLAQRYGVRPVTDLYNCTTSPCGLGGGPWVNQLRAAYGGPGAPTTVWPGSASPAPFQTLPSPLGLVPDFTCNGSGSTPPVVVPVGNWYVDCPGGLKVTNVLAFSGGHVVTSGPVELGSASACLAMNVPVSPATPTCPSVTATAPQTTDPAPVADSVLFIRTGRLYKVAQAQLFMPRTFTYLGNGYTDLGGGSGTLLMTAPRPGPLDCLTESCRNRRFQKVVLWSEGPQTHAMGGQSGLVLRGVLFTPNAPSTFTGQGGQQQADAQFWTRTLEIKGQGTLVMAADPDAAVPRPFLGVSLIR